MQVWIGTSGYSYPDWVGPFYPAGTRSKQMFGYYCRYFPLVELNFTFYRPPTPPMLARMARQAPTGFQYVVKLPQTLSHDRKPGDLRGFRESVEELKRANCLAGLLCQFPQSCHADHAVRSWVEVLAKELKDCALAVEFRHRSWFRPDVPDWLRGLGLSLVAVDVPDLPALYPRELVHSGRRIYLRLHSRNAQNWYGVDGDRYDYNYSDDELQEWALALRDASSRADSAFVLFNNCQRGQAAANARRMRELMYRLTPELNLVDSFAALSPQSQQRLLFD